MQQAKAGKENDMTTKERTAIQRFVNKLSELDEIKHAAFVELQNINEAHGDGNRWCSPDYNLDCLIAANAEQIHINRAKRCYRDYFEADAKQDLIRELGGTLADLGFWKE
jgi:hypothetical protein